METQIIILSDGDFLDSLYDLNLKIYVGRDPIIVKDMNLGDSPKKLIIARDVVFEKFNKELAGLNYPKIALGSFDKKPDHFTEVLENRYNMRELIRRVAGTLQVTAKEMAQKKVPEYFPVSKNLFDYLSKAICKVYHKTNDGHKTLYDKNAPITGEHQKIQDDIVYIPSMDRLSFINRASILVIEELKNHDLTAFEKIEIVSQGTQFVAEEIYQNQKVNDEIIKISKLCVQSFNEISNGVPKAKKLLELLLKNKDGYIYAHSVFTTYIAKDIISYMPWGSTEQQEKVSFVLFFHDLFLVPIYSKYPDAVEEEDLLFREDVSQEDKEIIFDHAAMASDFIKSYPKAPMGADTLAAQHHGATSGKGFPGVFGDDISPLAKVIVIAQEVTKHVFTHLDSKDSEGAFNKEAIKAKLNLRFTRRTYKKIIEAFDKVEL